MSEDRFHASADRLTRRMSTHRRESLSRAEVLARGSVPAECGPDIGVAPARGPVCVFTPLEVQKTASGNMRVAKSGHYDPQRGETAPRRGLRRADAFDVMQARSDARARGRKVAPVALFTTAQIEAGRTYAALVESLSAAGCGLSQLERGGGSATAGVNEAVIDKLDRLGAMRAAIGTGWAIARDRVDPGRDPRKPIRVRVLVDLVCIEAGTLTDVLRRHLWPNASRTQALLRESLAGALDRLYGL